MAEDKLCSCDVYNQKGNHHTIKEVTFALKLLSLWILYEHLKLANPLLGKQAVLLFTFCFSLYHAKVVLKNNQHWKVTYISFPDRVGILGGSIQAVFHVFTYNVFTHKINLLTTLI